MNFSSASALGAILLSAVTIFGQGSAQPVQVGYAVITPSTPVASGMVVYQTFSQTRSGDTVQVGVLPAPLTLNALLPIEVSALLSQNLGVAIANPNSATANITMIARRSDGTQLTTTTATVLARQQMSKLVTELFPLPASGGFSSQIGIPAEFNGTLVINSTSPVSIVGLKFRGSNPSAIPMTDLSPTSTPIPTILPGVGGLGAVLLPQFVTGGEWTTEIVIANTTAVSLTVRLDVFTQGASPLTVTLNGQTVSSFPNLVIPANGLLKIAP